VNKLPEALDEIELSIWSTTPNGGGAKTYFVQAVERLAESDNERQILDRPTTFVPPDLSDVVDEPAAYGKRLGEALFAQGQFEGKIRDAVQSLRGTGDKGFRFRLFSDDLDIQKLRWELVRFDDQPLFTSGICLSRCLSPKASTRKPQPRPALKALVFIASPEGLDTTDAVDDPGFDPRGMPEDQPKLARIDVGKELALAKKNLEGQSTDGAVSLTTEFLGSPGHGTMPELMRKLSEGFDILYLICHGAYDAGKPKLYLEDPGGRVLAADATELVQCFATMEAAPRLVVLASCQSAGSGDPVVASKSLTALGPLLARAGVPSVIAMQGFVAIATVEDFMPKLFSELRQHGQVDRAMAAARRHILSIPSHDDYWMPVLFSSSRSGTIFLPYTAGFETTQKDGEEDAEGRTTPWATIIERTRDESCVPVLGPDCLEPLWGSTIEIATWMAKKFKFPLEEHQSESLPAVAQFVRQDKAPAEYERALMTYLNERIPGLSGDSVWKRLSAAGKNRRASGVTDVHQLLARLRYPIYLTACADHLLEEAIEEVTEKKPLSDFVRWNEFVRNIDKFPKLETEPSADQPLVYHLFGDYRVPKSMVITEDDFTDYMLGINTQQATRLTPSFIDAALVDKALLMIGFHFKDRSFQIVLRNTLNRILQNGSEKNIWVGAQMPPDSDRYLRVNRARSYLMETIGSQMKLYWGNVQQFIEEFAVHARRELPERFEQAVGAGTK
jgi:CHAT domain/SIR2-like domain